MRKMLTCFTSLALLGACAPKEPVEDPARPNDMACNAESAASFIGEAYTADMDARLLQASGAEILRATHKDAPVTMDYRPERLTVAYDDNTVIVRLSCG